MELFTGLSWGLFIYQTIIFSGLLILLWKFAWKPILTAVNDREENIKGALEAAETTKLEVAKLKSQNDEMRKEALAERDVLLKSARETKDKIVAEAKNIAKAESDKIIASAKEEIKSEKMAALGEIKTQVAALSIEIAEKVVKHDLSGDDKQKALVDSLIEEVNLN